MKKQILLFLIICNIAAYGQTKKETIDWLNSKFEGSPIIVTDIDQYTSFLKINQDGSFSIQSYNYSPSVFPPNSKNYRWKTLFTGHFKNLSPTSITTKVVDEKLFIYATCSNGKCITQKNQGPNNFNSYQSSEVLLAITSDITLEARCKKAFIHLITLFGGKKEVF